MPVEVLVKLIYWKSMVVNFLTQFDFPGAYLTLGFVTLSLKLSEKFGTRTLCNLLVHVPDPQAFVL